MSYNGKRQRTARGYARTGARLARMAIPRDMTWGAAAGVGAGFGARYARPSTGRTVPGTFRKVAAAAAQKKAMSRTRTVTRMKTRTKDTGNMSDYSKVTANYGRAEPYVKKQLSIVNSNTEKTIWTLRGITKAWGQAGFHVLNSQQAGLNGTPVDCPCHIYDLTCVPNSNGTTAVGQTVGYKLGFTSELSTADVSWTALPTNLVGSTQWLAQTASHGNPERMEGGQSYLDWVNVKMLIYAAGLQPTKVLIELCQFTRDAFVPAPDVTVSNTEHNAFWQSMIHKYIWNPIHPVNGNYKKYYRVLKSLTVEMDAKESDENTPARYKEVNMFLKLGRKLNYRWKEDDPAGLNATAPQVIELQTNTAVNQPRVHPRKRLFLMIRSVTPLQFPQGINTPSNSVSYDIALTKKHLNLAPNF